MKLLFLGDENKTSFKIFMKVLSERNFVVDHFNTAEVAFNYFMSDQSVYDLVLADGGFTKINGGSIQERIRLINQSIPIFIFSEISDPKEKVAQFRIGVDDYVVIPFDPLEQAEKIESRLRRRMAIVYGQSNHIDIRGVELDIENNFLRYKDKQIELSKTEFKILMYLMLNKNRIIYRTELINKLWDKDRDYITSNTVDVHVSNIRNKLKSIGVEEFIKTVHGYGYRIG